MFPQRSQLSAATVAATGRGRAVVVAASCRSLGSLSLINHVCGRHFPPHHKHNVDGAQENATHAREPTWRGAESTGKWL